MSASNIQKHAHIPGTCTPPRHVQPRSITSLWCRKACTEERVPWGAHALQTRAFPCLGACILSKHAPSRCTRPRSALQIVCRKACSWAPRCMQSRSTHREAYASGAQHAHAQDTMHKPKAHHVCAGSTTRTPKEQRPRHSARVQGALHARPSPRVLRAPRGVVRMRPRGAMLAGPRGAAHMPYQRGAHLVRFALRGKFVVTTLHVLPWFNFRSWRNLRNGYISKSYKKPSLKERHTRRENKI